MSSNMSGQRHIWPQGYFLFLEIVKKASSLKPAGEKGGSMVLMVERNLKRSEPTSLNSPAGAVTPNTSLGVKWSLRRDIESLQARALNVARKIAIPLFPPRSPKGHIYLAPPPPLMGKLMSGQ